MLKAVLAQNIVEHLTTAILWLDDTSCLQAMNPAAEALLDISAKQAYGLNILTLLPQTDLAVIQQVKTRRIPLIEHNKQVTLANGRTITVNYSMTPINETGYINHLLIELIRIDQHLRITREENLISQQQAIKSIIRGLAHEIKNPLSGLRGAAQLLERELPNDLREYTRIIISEAARLQTLLNRMLGSHTQSHKKYVNIHEVLVHVQQLILSEWGADLTIECDFDPSIPELWADADQLLQALLNIMQNAAQAVEGKGNITLSTRIHRQMTLGNFRHKLVIRIDIIDNGPGIPVQMTDHIFYPLVTGRPEGTGLGLPIAQSLINHHHGLIEYTSRPGKTVFTLWLPVIQKENYEPKESKYRMGY